MEATKDIAVRLAENAAARIDAHGWRSDGSRGSISRCILNSVAAALGEETGENPDMVLLFRAEYVPPVFAIIRELTALIRPLEPCSRPLTDYSQQALVVHYNDTHCTGGAEAADLLRKAAKELAK